MWQLQLHRLDPRLEAFAAAAFAWEPDIEASMSELRGVPLLRSHT